MLRELTETFPNHSEYFPHAENLELHLCLFFNVSIFRNVIGKEK